MITVIILNAYSKDITLSPRFTPTHPTIFHHCLSQAGLHPGKVTSLSLGGDRACNRCILQKENAQFKSDSKNNSATCGEEPRQ